MIWTPEAERDREAIWAFIAAESPVSAARIDTLFGRAAMRLAEFPNSGVDGLIAGTRELIPHSKYRLVYEIRAEAVWVLALVHTARQWPPVTD